MTLQDGMAKELPDRSRVVVIGGGIVGCSVAYHLTKLGWTDVVVLERKALTGGTTWHAAGLVTQLRNSRTLIELARYSIELYSRLEAETSHATGFRQTGSITVARTEGRIDELKRIISLGRSFGIAMEEISPREAAEMWPLMRTDDLVGAVYIPGDGQTIPSNTAMAMAKGATNGGASIFENVMVTGVHQRRGAGYGVSTDVGDIACEVVVNCGGMWARDIGLMCGVDIPLHAAEHMYLVTHPMQGVAYDMPSLRDPDGHIYFRRDIEEAGALLMGGFEPEAKPRGTGSISEDYCFSLLEPDWDHFELFWDNAGVRVPTIKEAGINRLNVGLESFTPDNRYVMGEAPGLQNYYVAAGLNSTGIAAAPGVGKAMAEWIVEGHPTMDLWEVDIRRFHKFQNSDRYLHDRTVESVGLLYGMHWPHRQPETARHARWSPLHDRLAARGACFGVVAGWERPNWYAPDGVEPRYEYSFQRQNWFPYSAEEHRAVREAVGLFDQTSFAKFVLQGRDAEGVLQRICANDVAVPTGGVVYTSMLNQRGGIECDLTVTRTAEDRYLIVTSGATERRDFEWIKSNIPNEAHAFLTNVTSAYAVLGVMGPRSRELLSQLTDVDLSSDAFPFLSSREIGLGYATGRATRITYVGELGWELYIPTEFATAVYDAIIDRGAGLGLRHAGVHAMESLRSEKAYRAWGHDLTDQDTPLEAGLGFAVALDKETPFIGRDALLRQREAGLNRRLVIFTLDDPEPLLLGDEPIYRDGVLVGRITSGAFGHTLGRSVGMGYVAAEGVDTEFIRGGTYEIEIATERFPASPSLRPPYDPRSLRVRA
uniref:Putative glycine cleavage T-protein (Aminomethyl transferase) n=1 Tax=uncultured marine microorganism HF4000_APKG8C21 TaxID=455553 RepID=B3TA05_9ZZZZ|nr:putative glycine cleavage T-protein (aminomethyl transferase) [uncultured marine microorganism HF4000_APKG8C21]